MVPPRPSRLGPRPRPWRLRVRPLLTCGPSVPSSAASCSRNGDQGPDPRAALAIARIDGVHTAVLVPGATRGPHGSRPAGRDSAPGCASWARRGRGATSVRNSALSPPFPSHSHLHPSVTPQGMALSFPGKGILPTAALMENVPPAKYCTKCFTSIINSFNLYSIPYVTAGAQNWDSDSDV